MLAVAREKFVLENRRGSDEICLLFHLVVVQYGIGPVPADQALRVGRSRPTDTADAAGLKPRGERESGTSLTGTGYRVR